MNRKVPSSIYFLLPLISINYAVKACQGNKLKMSFFTSY